MAPDPQPTGSPHELLRQYLAIYDSYHNHKEVMAYTVTAFYLGGACVLIVGTPPFWRAYGPRDFVLLLIFLLTLTGIAFLFIRHQLRLRRSAGDMFKACARLANRWVSSPPGPEELAEHNEHNLDDVLFRGFSWPKALVTEMNAVQAQRRVGWWARD